jgi:hypothetical protein
MEQALLDRGLKGGVVVDVKEIHAISYDSFNNILRKLDRDADFRKLFLANGAHILSEIAHFELGNALERLHAVIVEAESRGGPLNVRRTLSVREPQLARAITTRALQSIRALSMSGLDQLAQSEIEKNRLDADRQRQLATAISDASQLLELDILDKAMAIAEMWLRRSKKRRGA